MQHKWLALGLGLVVVASGMGWQSWQLVSVARGHFIDDASLRLRAVARPETGTGLEQIAGMHLFGNAADKPAPPPMPTELPKTDLKLVLVGAITDSDPQRASALIEAERQTRRYYVGDSIPGGAVLHQVQADSVVLKRDNRYETLSFPKAGDAASRSPAPGFVASPPSSAPAAPPRPVQAVAPAGGGMRNQAGNERSGLSLRERLLRSQSPPGPVPDNNQQDDPGE